MTNNTLLSVTVRQSLRVSLVLAAALMFGDGGHERVVLGQGGPCASPANPVVAENCLPGDTDWPLLAGPDPSIQGYAADISVNRGGTVTFKVLTDAIAYRIDIYRLGHYNGAGARKVDSLPVTLATPQDQPNCFTDPITGLVDCGGWAASATWPSGTATSGIYIAKLVRTDGGSAGSNENHMVFVLRDDARQSALLMQTSDTTWQAYNRYGGASLYCGGPISNTGTAYECATRAAKVSYNRPFDTPDHDPRSWVLATEHPMLRWLEANGYDVTYATGIDTDRFPANLLNHKVFLSVGHDEYWSGAQRANVEAARDAGVNLAFFSGNEMFWKVRWEASADGSDTPYRTLVSYKETLANAKIDPTAEWTGTWRDARFSPPADGGRPENGLTGTIWTVNCCSYPLQVPYEMSQNRFWRNTSITQLTPGTVATLANETLGYEWDEDLNNGFRPAGLTRLSSTTVDVPEKLIDNGGNFGPGTATHALTLYRKNSGVDQLGNPITALVFGAGTVQWSWGLEGNHSVSLSTPDFRMRQATVNLLADMGAQPATLQPGLTPATASTDTVAPTSSVTAPSAGSTIPAGRHATVIGTATDTGGVVAGVELSFDGGTSWYPARGAGATWSYEWMPGSLGAVTILTRATDDSGNVGTPGGGVTVTVVANDCPCTSLWNPALVTPAVVDAGDANAIEVGVKFRSDIAGFITGIRFYKSVANTGTHIGNLWTAGGTPLASAVFTGETLSGWQEVRFAAPVAIAANTTYVASYHTNLGHYSGDQAYFVTSVDSPPLHAPANSPATGNGVYAYGASQFPTQTFHALNYWVDVMLAEAATDTSGPVISQIRATALDGATALVTWDTSELANSRVEYSTDPSFPPALTHSVTNGAFVTHHSLTLTGLTFNTTYFLRLTSADPFGNATLATAPSLVVPGPTLRDTTAVDFQAGAPAAVCDENGQNCVATTYVSQTANGELILAPAIGSEFFGATLMPGWTVGVWTGQGGATVGGGMLTVDGVRFGTCDVTIIGDCEVGTHLPRRVLEFAGTFTGDSYQHAGLGVKFEAGPWAIFSTGADGGLYARSNNGIDPETITLLGPALLGAQHVFRIDWDVNSVTYLVDGITFATHPVSIAGPMRPIAASDYQPFNGNVSIDWIRMGPYPASGSFLSRVFDAVTEVDWQSAVWTADTPAGTSVAISVRTGSTPTPDAENWTSFTPIAAPGPLSATHGRYIQYRAQLASTDPWKTPELSDILLTTDRAPVAVDDSATTSGDTPYVFPPTGVGSLTANDTDADTPASFLRVVALTPPAHGTAILSGNGLVVYTPATGYTGADTFTYTISDGLLTATATVHMSVGNTPPDADPQLVTTSEDTPVAIALTASDADNDTLTLVVLTPPQKGTLSGTFPNLTYTPNADATGSDSFVYKVTDGLGAESSPTTVSITIDAVNDAPVANAGVLAVTEDTAATGTLTASDVDAGTAFTYSVVAQGSKGTVAITDPATGAYTYTPNLNATGSDSFTFKVSDGTADSNVAAISVTITTVNDAPAANAGTLAATEDTVASGTLTASDIDEGTALTYSVVAQGSKGTVAITDAATGAYTYTPNLNATGSDSFTFKVSDGTADSNVATISVTIAPVNDAPVANAGALAATEDTATNGTLTASDVDAGTTFTYSVVAQGSKGTVTITDAATGAYTYTPNLNATGSDSFTFKVSDGTVDSSVEAVIVTIGPVNDAPVANAGTLAATEDTVANGTLTASDVDEGTAFTYSVVAQGSKGTVAITNPATGAYTYTPNLDANGPDSFTFKVSDGTADSTVATISVTIAAVNDAPVANAGALGATEDTAATGTLTASDVDAGTTFTYSVVAQGSKGTVAITNPATGAYTYTPNLNATGGDSFTFKVSDGTADSNVATISVTIAAVNDAPVANAGALTATEDTVANGTLTASDIDEGTALTYSVVAQGSKGTVAITNPATGAYTYAPNLNATGSDSFTFKVSDGTADSNVATISVTIAAVNDAPVANAGALTATEDTVANGTLTASDIDEGTALTYSVVAQGSKGTVAISDPATGAYTYTPNANATGSDSFTFKVTDGTTDSNVAAINVTIAAVNDAPIANAGALAATEDTAATGTLTASDVDAGTAFTYSVVAQGSKGTVAITNPATGAYTYTPNPDATGSDSFTFKVSDGTTDSNVATINVTIAAVNDAPVANAGALGATEDTAATGTLTASDVDAGTTFTYSVVAQGSKGTVVITNPATGAYTYTPNLNATGSDSFTFKASDGTADSNVAAINVTIAAVNDAPIANAGVLAATEDTAATGTLTASDVDAGTTFTYSVVAQGSKGTVAITDPATGAYTYTPNLNATGSDSFTFKVSDGTADSNVAAINVTIAAVNDAPVANAGALAATEDAAATGTLTASDGDAGTTFTYSVVAQGSKGTVAITDPATGAYTYTPNLNATGSDSFTFKVTDGTTDSNVATINVTIAAVNDAPVANAGALAATEDTAATGTLTASDVDAGTTFTYSVVAQGSKGTVAITDPATGAYTYTPNLDANGSDSFTFKVSDGTTDSNVPTISVTIAAVNDAPVADAGALAATEDAAATGTLTASDVDPGTTFTYSVVAQGSKGTVAITNPATGAYSYTPNLNATGSDSFTFKVSDGTVDSTVATISVTIAAVNDAPIANAGALAATEDTAATGTLTASDVDAGTTFTYSVVAQGSKGTVAITNPATGAYTYTPNLNANGSDSFTFKVTDGTTDSNVATINVTIAAVNDVPSFTKGANQSVPVNSGAQTVAGWATAISAGPANESAQALNFIVSNTNNPLFSAQPAVSAAGTLTYTPAAAATGTATVTVQLHDNGGGTDTSAAQTFTITVNAPASLAISNASVVEGNSGLTPMPFTVTLSSASSQTVTVNWTTLNGTATTPKDYVAASGALTFVPGDLSKTVTIQIKGETTKENNETLTVRLSNAVNATIADADGIGAIVDDDNTPQMMMSSATVTEGHSGQKMMTFAVTPTNGNWLPMSVDYTTIAGVAAREGVDYTPVSGTIVIPAETTDPVFVSVPVHGNMRHQPNHKVILRLANAIEAILGATDSEGTIIDDDPAPSISMADVTIGEAGSGTVNAAVNVTLSNETDDVVTVNFAMLNGTAIAGTDFLAHSGTLTFQPGVTSQVITIAVTAATVGEANEWFTVNLSDAANGNIADGQAIVTIVPPSSWLTTTVGDFSAGTPGTATYLANAGGGEVVLMPTAGSEFNGTALPTGWVNGFIETGGTTTIANGIVTVDKATVLAPTTYTSGRTLEFVATFNGQPNQSAGFASTSALLPPMAVFGVKADGQFYARSLASGTVLETPIPGNWFNSPHLFRINWTATTTTYWIDGIQRASHTISWPAGATGKMRPAMTDQTLSDGGLSVDWMRMSAYTASGIYTSPVYDAGAVVPWLSATWLADLPAGTSVVVQIGTGNTVTPDGSWTWAAVQPGAALNRTARYAQYKLTLSTTAPNATPSVREVVVNIQR